jgi:hypothetical protein
VARTSASGVTNTSFLSALRQDRDSAKPSNLRNPTAHYQVNCLLEDPDIGFSLRMAADRRRAARLKRSRPVIAAGYKIHAVVCSHPRASLLSSARCGLRLRDPWAYAATNSVPSRSFACMMMARRRARATRAFRIVDCLAIAKASP